MPLRLVGLSRLMMLCSTRRCRKEGISRLWNNPISSLTIYESFLQRSIKDNPKLLPLRNGTRAAFDGVIRIEGKMLHLVPLGDVRGGRAGRDACEWESGGGRGVYGHSLRCLFMEK